MKIAVDAMGGDHAPEAIIQGTIDAVAQFSDIEIILVGDESVLQPRLQGMSERIHIHHASDAIAADDEPVRAVRRKKDASMVVAGRLVKEKKADAMISAGNTGALMTVGLLVVGRIPGIERPALSPMIPTMDGQGVLALDLGANMDATPQHLQQYAVMGRIYRERVHGLARPRVGLLNVGTEAKKGNELTKAAFPLLEQSDIHFVGNVESREVLFGNCDVLVCDGFVGNILLKAMEGASGAIFGALKQEFTRNLPSKLAAAVLKPGLSKFKRQMDYTEHGGAPLLGVQGVVIKAHGSSDANALKNAIRQAREAIQCGLVHALNSEFDRERIT